MSDSSSSIPSSPTLSEVSLPESVPPTPLARTALLPEVDENDRKQAAAIKITANAAFASQNYLEAAELYSNAIALDPTDKTFWLNRAVARIKLEEFGYAISDVTKALEIDPQYAKAYYRRGSCNLQLLKYSTAISDFKLALKLEPANAVVKQQLVSTQKLLRKTEFEKAIEFEGEKDPLERCREIIKEGGCEVEPTYDGPKLEKLEDGKMGITAKFVEEMILRFKEGKGIPRRYVWEIALTVHELLVAEESLVNITLEKGMTCDVIGDVHGQFYDMLHLFSLTGQPSATHFLLMNGDLVDRGSWSVEVILVAFAYKWLHPKRFYINRGNHEAKDMNRAYGFEGETKHKHGEQTYKLFAQVFTALPLATLVSATQPPQIVKNPQNNVPILSPEGFKRFFVVHGGLFSKDGVTLDDIRKISRLGRQPGQEGLMCELLWTDPQELPGRGPSKRGVGVGFGPDVTRKWCTLNNVTGIVRSHEVRLEGYAVEHDGLCTTVFSAPNYCDQTGNKAAFVRIDDQGNHDITQFEAQPHPPMRPMQYASMGMM